MKFAILAIDSFGSSRARAEGLQRMFDRIGQQSRILYGCWGLITRLGTGYKPTARFPREVIWDLKAIATLARYDLLILCGFVPEAFLRNEYGIRYLRKLTGGKPIVLYTVSYIGNSPDWQNRIYHCGGYGISRYDWHLAVSSVGKKALEANQPCNAIGINVEEPELFPASKKGFMALLDFERRGFEPFREMQVQALREMGIEYIELKGEYTFSEIRAIYRKTSIYFLAHLESFGLPICETQLCGNYVFTPDRRWPQAHRNADAFARDGSITLSENFVVYGDLQDLKRKIALARQSHDPDAIHDRFLATQAEFYSGNLDQLRQFVKRAERGGLWGSQYDEGNDRLEAIKRSYLLTDVWTM